MALIISLIPLVLFAYFAFRMIYPPREGGEKKTLMNTRRAFESGQIEMALKHNREVMKWNK